MLIHSPDENIHEDTLVQFFVAQFLLDLGAYFYSLESNMKN